MYQQGDWPIRTWGCEKSRKQSTIFFV